MELVRLAIILLVVSATTSCALELEAEDGASYLAGARMNRGAASNDATVMLHQRQSITFHFSVFSSCTVYLRQILPTQMMEDQTPSLSPLIKQTLVAFRHMI